MAEGEFAVEYPFYDEMSDAEWFDAWEEANIPVEDSYFETLEEEMYAQEIGCASHVALYYEHLYMGEHVNVYNREAFPF